MLRCYFKLPQKDIGVPQVAVSSPFCRTVSKLFGYEQALLDKTRTGNNEYTEQRCFCLYVRRWEKCWTCS